MKDEKAKLSLVRLSHTKNMADLQRVKNQAN